MFGWRRSLRRCRAPARLEPTRLSARSSRRWTLLLWPDARRIAREDGVGRDVARHDRAGSDERPGADPEAAEDDGARAQHGAAFDDRREQLPIIRRLELPGLGRRPRVLVVDEQHAVSDKDLVLDRHARADEAMALDLAARADNG